MKKKVISVVLVGAMVASMVAMTGCGSSSSSSSTDDAAATTDGSAAAESGTDATATADVQSDDENTLTIMAWDPNFNIPILEAAEAAYQEKNPDFHLEILEQSASSDIETLLTNVGSDASGKSVSQLPDIILFQDHYFQQYHTNYPDLFQDLSTAADVNWDDFSAEKLSFSTIDDVHYGMPVDAGTAVACYRTDLLEEAGYTVDDLTGCSWDEFMTIGEDVYAATGKYLLCMDGSGNDLFYMMCQAEGVSQFKDGQPYITENETLVQITQLLADMVNNNVLYLANDWSGYTNDAIQKDMVAGVINGNWIIPTIEAVEDNSGKWAVTTLPTLEGGQEGYSSNGGSSLYITANCSKTDLAVDFLSYTLGGGDGAAATYGAGLTNGGLIGTWTGCADLPEYTEGVAYFNDQAIYSEIASWTANVPTVEQNDHHYDARNYMGSALQAIIAGTDVDSALADAEQQLSFTMEE